MRYLWIGLTAYALLGWVLWARRYLEVIDLRSRLAKMQEQWRVYLELEEMLEELEKPAWQRSSKPSL